MRRVELERLLDNVKDKTTFFDFLEALIADREDGAEKEKKSPISPYGQGAGSWENGSIETYLEAMLAWSEAWNDDPSLMPDQPSWHTFAQMLYSAKSYE